MQRSPLISLEIVLSAIAIVFFGLLMLIGFEWAGGYPLRVLVVLTGGIWGFAKTMCVMEWAFDRLSLSTAKR